MVPIKELTVVGLRFVENKLKPGIYIKIAARNTASASSYFSGDIKIHCEHLVAKGRKCCKKQT